MSKFICPFSSKGVEIRKHSCRKKFTDKVIVAVKLSVGVLCDHALQCYNLPWDVFDLDIKYTACYRALIQYDPLWLINEVTNMKIIAAFVWIFHLKIHNKYMHTP